MVLSDKLRRSATLAVAGLLFAASLVPLLDSRIASAYGLITSRSIQMSSSVNGSVVQAPGQIGGQNVIYSVAFTTATTASLGSVLIEFCDGSSSPIIGDSCTAPTGFNTNYATTSISGITGITGLSVDTTAGDYTAYPNNNAIILTRTAGSVNSGVSTTFTLGTVGSDIYSNTNGLTNPTDTDSVAAGTQNGTFYARIHTKASTDGSGADIDAGGIALSLANQITVTSKVQERLTFCVYVDPTFAPVNDCASPKQDATNNAISLGDTNGVLDDTGSFADGSAFYSISTNASTGAAVRVIGTTLKLTPACSNAGGNNCSIDPVGATPTQRVIGSEQFGFCTYQFTAGSSNLTIDSTYDGTGGGSGVCANGVDGAGLSNSGTGSSQTSAAGATEPYFAYDTGNTISTYGDTIATKPAGTFSTGRLFFIGDIASTTEPGIYSAILTFVATGQY